MANKVAKKKTKKKAAKVAETSVVQRPAEVLDAHGNVIDRINMPDPFDKLSSLADRVVIRRG